MQKWCVAYTEYRYISRYQIDVIVTNIVSRMTEISVGRVCESVQEAEVRITGQT